MKTDKCEKCGKRFKNLLDGVCFFCDKEKWYAFYNKIGKKKNE